MCQWPKYVVLVMVLVILGITATGCFFDPQFVEEARRQYELVHGLRSEESTQPAPAGGTEATSPQQGQAVQGSTHSPYASQECGACHDVRAVFRLKAEGGALCETCHGKEDFAGKYVHPPVAAGECLACHDPHRSDYQHLLVAEGKALCTSCHDLQDVVKKAEFHKDVGEECLSCHQPHKGEDRRLLR